MDGRYLSGPRGGAWACRNARARHVHPNRAWAMQGGSAYASEQGLDNAGMLTQGIGGPNVGGPNVSHRVVPMCPTGVVPMWSHGGGPNVVPSGLGEACRAAYARRASSHVHANRLLRLAALWDRPCGSGLLCAHQASSPRVNLQRPSNENTPTGNMH